MKKNLRVIQINGFRGLCMAMGIGVCLIAGFIVFPGLVAMAIWNKFLTSFVSVPALGILQGILLWGIVIVTYMIVSKRSVMVSFAPPKDLSKDELDEVMKQIRYETTAKMMSDVIKSARNINKEQLKENFKNDDIKEECEISNKNIDN